MVLQVADAWYLTAAEREAVNAAERAERKLQLRDKVSPIFPFWQFFIGLISLRMCVSPLGLEPGTSHKPILTLLADLRLAGSRCKFICLILWQKCKTCWLHVMCLWIYVKFGERHCYWPQLRFIKLNSTWLNELILNHVLVINWRKAVCQWFSIDYLSDELCSSILFFAFGHIFC